MRKRIALALIAVALLIVNAGFSGVAAAPPQGTPGIGTPTSKPTTKRCPNGQVTGILVASKMDTGKPQKACYNSAADARAAMMGSGAPVGDSNVTPQNHNGCCLDLMYMYEGANRTGALSIIFGPGCEIGPVNIYDGFNDVMSSFDMFCYGSPNGPFTYNGGYYIHENADGCYCGRFLFYGSGGYTSYIGDYMNDRASSVTFLSGSVYYPYSIPGIR